MRREKIIQILLTTDGLLGLATSGETYLEVAGEWQPHIPNVTRPPAPRKVTLGEDNSRAVLTNKEVRFIKKHLRDETLTQKELAKQLGVAQSTISHIHTHRTWKTIK